jgi:hypothetical protein
MRTAGLSFWLIRLLVLGVLLGLPGAVEAQSINQQRPFQAQRQQFQSLQATPSPCTSGSQSVRVCSDDLRSCNSVCTAAALDPFADIAGCGTRCCVQFNTCLRLRGCGPRVLNCF